jgi:putative lipoic acid-binding regulatory protein
MWEYEDRSRESIPLNSGFYKFVSARIRATDLSQCETLARECAHVARSTVDVLHVSRLTSF